jgi:hypothetical protein
MRPARAAAFLSPLAVCILASPAAAHALVLDCFLLPDGRTRVEAFYDPGGEPARGAEVVVRGPGGVEIARGIADDRGGIEFTAAAGARVQVEARDANGHRADTPLTIQSPESGAQRAPRRDRGGLRWGRLAAGFGVIAALALLARLVFRRRHAS